MATEWFHKSGDVEHGPMPFADLVEAARAGKVSNTDLVRSNWHAEWQPADSVLGQHFPLDRQGGTSEWSDTVKAALAASRARQAPVPAAPPDSDRTGPGLLEELRRVAAALAAPFAGIGRLALASLAWAFEWLGPLWERASVWLPFAVPAFFAIAAGGAVGLAIENWSAADALLRHVKANPAANVGPLQALPERGPPVTGRRIPWFGKSGFGKSGFGESSRKDYKFYLADIVLATAAAAYAAAWLLLSERRPAKHGIGGASGSSQGATATVRRLLGGRVVGACLLAAICAVWLRDSPVFDTSPERIHTEAFQVVEQVRELTSRDATAEEWDALDADIGRMAPAVAKMHKRAGETQSTDTSSPEYYVNSLIRRPLVQIGRYDLPALLRDARRNKLGPTRIELLERDLDKVRKSLDVMSLGGRGRS